MAWQTWLAPSFVGIILGLVVSFFTARQTRRHAEKMFQLQRRAQDEDERRARGRDLAGQALTQLNVLRDNLHYIVFGRHNEARWNRCQDALKRLEHITIVLPDAGLRARLVLVHDVLSYPDEITQWGKPSFNPHEVVSIGTSEGIQAIGAFIRGDDLPELSDRLRGLQASYDVTMEELDWQHKEQKRLEVEYRREQRKKSGPNESGG